MLLAHGRHALQWRQRALALRTDGSHAAAFRAVLGAQQRGCASQCGAILQARAVCGTVLPGSAALCANGAVHPWTVRQVRCACVGSQFCDVLVQRDTASILWNAAGC